MNHRRLVACIAALALGGGPGTIATTAASAAPEAPMHAGDWSQPQLPAQIGNGDEDYIVDETANASGLDADLTAPDTNGEQAYFVQSDSTWFELEQTTTIYNGDDTYWLCSNGSSHHCLQDEDGPVDVELKAGTSGQYWYFGQGYICNVYWSIHGSGFSCMNDKGGKLYATGGDVFSLTKI